MLPMSSAGEWLATFASVWAAGMIRALGWSVVGVSLVLLVCRLWRQMPPRIRHWLWWITCAKALVALALPAVVCLQILPSGRRIIPKQYSPAIAVITAKPHPLKPPARASTATALPITTAPATETISAAPPLVMNLRSVLFALYALVVLAIFGRCLFQWNALRRIVQNSAEAPQSLLETAQSLARDMRPGHSPRVRISDRTSSPQIAGFFRPVILVPADLCQRLSVDELRMAIAHELAHLRNTDLWLSVVPMLAGAVLFPFPHVWLAVREYLAAREEACDAAAAKTGDAAKYARLLLTVATTPRVGASAVAMTSSHRTLRRRLLSIAAGRRDNRGSMIAGALVCCGAALGLTPFRIAAKPIPPAPPAKEPAAIPEFRLTDLGPLTDGEDGAMSINDRGDVGLISGGHAVVVRDGAASRLGGLPHYRRDVGVALSNNGTAIAACLNYDMYPHGYVHGGSNMPLAGAEGFKYTQVAAVNDAGEIAGSVQNGRTDAQGADVAHAAVWSNGKSTLLGTLGGDYSRAFGINDNGDIVGKADLPRSYFSTTLHGYSRRTHAFLWTSGAMADLQTLGGDNSLAYAINDHGQVVGYSETAAGDTHACLWQNGQPIDLGTIGTGSQSQAVAINNQGYAVGTSGVDRSGMTHAALWVGGRGVDLNKRVVNGKTWILAEARSINNGNAIVGSGSVNGERHAFLLTPVE